MPDLITCTKIDKATNCRMIEAKAEIISKTCIKPATPTPHHLKTKKVSLLDQLSPNLHNVMTIFYHNSVTCSRDDYMSAFSTNSLFLQNSLSETLSLFYPLAGRFKDDATVVCDDVGVVFIEAKTEIRLSDILTHPDLDAIGSHFFLATDELKAMKELQRPLLFVGFTLFACGSTALSICITHKVCDLASVVTLVQSWTASCRGTKPVVVPELNIAASILPPREILNISEAVVISSKKIASIRLVFKASKVAELKAKVLSQFGKEYLKHYPSRADVVMALIWKCAVNALKSKSGKFKKTVLMQAVNLRNRMDPPLPENSMGNLAWLFPLTIENESEMEIHELVSKMITMKSSLKSKATKFSSEEIVATLKEGLHERQQLLMNEKDIAVYLCASWCKFPMLEFDFGWGKPVWVTSIDKGNLMGNTIHLADTRVAGEVEALVHLDEEEMKMFIHNDELLHYALINPRII